MLWPFVLVYKYPSCLSITPKRSHLFSLYEIINICLAIITKLAKKVPAILQCLLTCLRTMKIVILGQSTQLLFNKLTHADLLILPYTVCDMSCVIVISLLLYNLKWNMIWEADLMSTNLNQALLFSLAFS